MVLEHIILKPDNCNWVNLGWFAELAPDKVPNVLAVFKGFLWVVVYRSSVYCESI